MGKFWQALKYELREASHAHLSSERLSYPVFYVRCASRCYRNLNDVPSIPSVLSVLALILLWYIQYSDVGLAIQIILGTSE